MEGASFVKIFYRIYTIKNCAHLWSAVHSHKIFVGVLLPLTISARNWILFMNIKKDVLLSPMTTFRVGGKADYFCEVKNIKELDQALLFAREKNLPFFVLGGGSNILVSDDGFPGLVIKMNLIGRSFDNLDNKKVRLEAWAGETWDDVVQEVVDRELYGIENLSAIPGTVGATPIQNIGAYGEEVKNTIAWVLVFDTEKNKLIKLNNEECQFGYRHSLFKTKEGKNLIVLKVAYDLLKYGSFKIDYAGVKEYLVSNDVHNLDIKMVREAIVNIRKNKLPNLEMLGTAGSFFKNPIIPKDKSRRLRFLFPDMPLYYFNSEYDKTSAAWLLDKVGKWNGVFKEDVGVYEKQPVVIVNRGKAKARDIFMLAREIVLDIEDKTGILLEFEVNTVGEF